VALRGRRSVASALDRLDDFLLAPGDDPRGVLGANDTVDDLTAFVRRNLLDAYATADRIAEVTRGATTSARYPATSLAGRLELIARLLKCDFGARVYYTLQPGYDTHSAQRATHEGLLFELAGALKAFLDDLAAARLAERVVVLCFSEFGRTVVENGSAGTDHGTSGPVFLVGPCVRAGLVGTTPSLTDLDPPARRPAPFPGLPPGVRYRAGGLAGTPGAGCPGRDIQASAAVSERVRECPVDSNAFEVRLEAVGFEYVIVECGRGRFRAHATCV
jgi:hypothetical protein